MIKSIATLPKPSLKEALGLIGLALPIGATVGVVDVIFGKGLLFLSEYRDHHLFLLLPFLALAYFVTSAAAYMVSHRHSIYSYQKVVMINLKDMTVNQMDLKK